MSVCSQMGNGHGKGEKKKKKDLVKEVTGLVDGPPREQLQLGNGDPQQEGSELFHQERSRRRYVLKDLAKECSTTSHDCGDGEMNVGPQGYVSPNEAIQDNVRSTLQNGEDETGAFGDSSLASDHVTGNKSDMVCGDVMAGEHNKATAGTELVKSDMSTGDATGNAVDNIAIGGNTPVNIPGSTPVGIPGDTPVDIPANVSDGIPGTVPVCVPANVTDDIPGTVPVNVPVDVPDHVETPGDISSDCVQSGVVPTHASPPNQTVPSMASTQKKTPTTGDDMSSESDKTGSEYISSNQSTQPTPPSKIESSSPTPMQIVSGVNHTKSVYDGETENLKVADQLISEVVTDNSLFLERLSKYLDRESRVIKCWKHLAYVLNVPPEERNRFDAYTEHSPTEDLFNYLSDIWNPDLTVKELKGKLKLIHRNDVIADIEKGGFRDVEKVSNLISGKPKFIKLLSPKLDMESRTIGNWRSLATEFGIRKQKTEQFGLRGSGPTGALFLYVQTAEGLQGLTMAQLRSHFEKMERNDLVNLLDKKKIEGSKFVKNELVDGSELLADIGERLNKEIRAVKNWRNLAYRLEIPNETYSAFDTSKEKAKSPTKMMFEWLAKWKPALNMGDLLKSIKAIDRFDVVEIVTKEAQAALEKRKKDMEASKQQCTFVDGSTEHHTASQVLHDLHQMHQDADVTNAKTSVCYSNLKKIAFDKGFRISDNPGQGNCMFYALSEQLEFAKRIHYSAAELRQKIVQYLYQNPKQPDGTDLVNFTNGYASWTSYLENMAKDGVWGDNVMLWAAAHRLNTPIRVISSLPDHEDIIIKPSVCHGDDTLVLGHVHEVHYVSLLPLPVSGLGEDVVPRGNPMELQTNGQDGQYGQQLGRYQQRQTEQPQQGYHQQMQLYQQRMTDQELQLQRRYQRPQDNQQRQGYPHHPSVQQLPGQRVPLSRDLRINMKVLDLPLKDVYSKICVKLNIKRDVYFDDFRMLAEELGMDRDLTAYAGQQVNPTDFIFREYHPNVTVDELVKILGKIERLDVAAVLVDWIEQGST